MAKFIVKSDFTLMRSSVGITDTNLLNGFNKLYKGHLVELLDNSNPTYWKVRTTFNTDKIKGIEKEVYLESKDLQPYVPPVLMPDSDLPAVHFHSQRLVSINGNPNASPLNMEGMPVRKADGTSSEKIASLNRIIDFLNVEKSNRYAPQQNTYCNIYAYDYAYLAKVYLPRVWWVSAAITQIKNGQNPAVLYNPQAITGNTVNEVNANGLYDWFKGQSAKFGWQKSTSVQELQAKANEGCVCMIVAKHKNGNASGHIVAVIPETEKKKALFGANGKVLFPLQSQAGRQNQQRYPSDWFTRKKSDYIEIGFWWHA